MPTIALKASINNEFRLEIKSDYVGKRNRGDTPGQRRHQRRHEQIKEVEVISAMIRNAEVRALPDVCIDVCIAEQLSLPVENCSPIHYSQSRTIVREPERICKYIDVRPDGKYVLVKAPVSELEARKSSWTLPRNCNKSSKPRWGRTFSPKAFTRGARHTILEAGAVLDRKYEPGEICELTLTLPGDTQEAMKQLANYSSWIVNRLTQIIRNQPDHEHIDYLFVWEFQDRGALHMHWAIASPTRTRAYCLSEELKDSWYALLFELERTTGTNLFANSYGKDWRYSCDKWQWRVSPVRKSIASYYSKYLSKSAEAINKKKRWKSRAIYYPSRWWGICRRLNQEVKKWRISVEFSISGLIKPDILEELVSTQLETIATKSQSYSYEYCVQGHPMSPPFASGKVNICYFPRQQWEQVFAYLKLMQSCLRLCIENDCWKSTQLQNLYSQNILIPRFSLCFLHLSSSELRELEAILLSLPKGVSRLEFALELSSAVRLQAEASHRSKIP